MINLLGKIQSLDAKIIQAIPDDEFEKFFESIIKKISSLKESQSRTGLENTTKLLDSIDNKEFSTKQDHVFTYLEVRNELITEIEANNREICPVCEGKGWTDYYEECPPCEGEGLIPKRRIENIDFSQYDIENCPLCKGNGRTDEFEECPPCGGWGKLSKQQIENIDFDEFNNFGQ